MRRRDPLAVAAVLLAIVAFAGSFTHVEYVVWHHGQRGWISYVIAAMPEVSVALSVMKVRRARITGEATGWAWLVGTSAAVFTLAANLSTAEHTTWGYVVAAWPAWASIGAFGLVELGGTPAPAPVEVVQVEDPESRLEPGAPQISPLGIPSTEICTEPEPEPVLEAKSSGNPPAALAPRPVPVAAARSSRPATVTERADDDPLLVAARRAAADLTKAGKRVTRDSLVNALRDARHTCSNAKASELLRQLRETA